MSFRHTTEDGKEYVAHRPQAAGRSVMASTGHPLATRAALRILEKGGNAIDAGVAAGICINVILSDFTSFLGVAPIIVYLEKEKRVVSIDGVGRWPRTASREWFLENCGGEIPIGVRRTVTPAAVDSWLLALDRWGTKTFAEVAGDAMVLAGEGFAMFPVLRDHIAELRDAYYQFEETRKIFFRGGEPIPVGGRVVQADLAETMRRMARAEEKATGGRGGPDGRGAGLRAARDEIYRGETARRITDFVQAEGGLLTMEDLAECGVREEEPVRTAYRGIDLYACGPWCQGPVLPAALNLLENTDLRALGHNSPEYLHRLLSALDLSFADRHAFYGDPDFARVPIEGILSKAYAKERAKLMEREEAFGEMPPAGDPWKHQGGAPEGQNGAPARPRATAGDGGEDTSYCTVIDAEGNAFSATPSDPSADTPMIPGVGCTVSSRGSQSWLEEGHPSAVAPWKRPRLSPSPALALKDGKIYMTLGSPGGDVQPQAMLQVFLNIVEFGMLPQMAVEVPRAASRNFPNSFWPHAYVPGQAVAEERICRESGSALRERGYLLDELPAYSRPLGSVCCIVRDEKEGTLLGGADARRASSAGGW